MKLVTDLLTIAFSSVLALHTEAALQQNTPPPPNVLLILADDLGYGDVGCYGSKAIPTPNIDRLAREGLRFTDAHASSATCTPSRYALFTGQYPWRKQGTGILPGNAALIIDPGSTTLPSVLKQAGFRTGAIGKWHLGLGPKGGPDWNGVIKPGPLEIGFDYCFLMPATGDRVPCVYVENHRVVGLDPADPIQVSFGKPIGSEPTGAENPELLKLRPSHGHDNTIVNGISRIGFMTGGKAARWVDEDMADTFVRKAVAFLEKNQAGPFFLYFGAHDPHVPRVPHPRFVGKSQCGPRGDAIVQFDWCVGQLMDALAQLRLTDRTMVILSSDNGPVVDDGYQDKAVQLLGNHNPAGPWRGGKYSHFEGGTRVPFIVRWPGQVKPGTSDALVCQMDLLASVAALTGQRIEPGAAFDSENILPALLGHSRVGRIALVEHAGGLALREGKWKYIEPRKGPPRSAATGTEMGNDPSGLLFDLSADPGEKANLISGEPEKAKELAARLAQIRQKQGAR